MTGMMNGSSDSLGGKIDIVVDKLNFKDKNPEDLGLVLNKVQAEIHGLF